VLLGRLTARRADAAGAAPATMIGAVTTTTEPNRIGSGCVMFPSTRR
jgi:hypothetical protein